MVVDGEVERERFSFSLNFQFRREHFYLHKTFSGPSMEPIPGSSIQASMNLAKVISL